MNFRNTLSSLLAMVVTGAGAAFCQTENNEENEAYLEPGAIIVSSTEDLDGSGIATRVMAVDSSSLRDGAMFMTDSLNGQFDFSFGGMGNSFSMLSNPSVQKDLQLVDEQLQQINDINAEFAGKIKQQLDELTDENGNFSFSNPSELQELMQDLRQQQQDQIDSILLPSQQQRLKQVSRQMKIKRTGTAGALTNQLAEELGISDEQRERIKNRSEELQQELDRKIAELKADAKDKLMKELSREQRQKLKDLIGDEFVVKDEDLRSRFRRFPQRKQSRAGDF